MKCNVNKNHQKSPPPNNLQGNNSKKDTLLPVDDVTEGSTQEAPMGHSDSGWGLYRGNSNMTKFQIFQIFQIVWT